MAYPMVVTLLATALTVPAAHPAPAAPGGPGRDQQYLPADKAGLLTSADPRSKVWVTLARGGGSAEIFYPDLGTPSARALQFVVAPPSGPAVRATDPRTEMTSAGSLGYRQTYAGQGWQLTTDYTVDTKQAVVLVKVRLTGEGHRLYTIFDPALGNSRGGDSGRTDRDALIATDGPVSSALAASPAFTATSSGYAGVSDGLTDLLADGRMDWRYPQAAAGSLVQTAETPSTATLALGFGGSPSAARAGTRSVLARGFDTALRAYETGWSKYLRSLNRPPEVADERLWKASAMILAASEDKTHRGAYIAAPAAPWAFGRDDPSGPYHLVWSRDLYQIATGLIAAGDRAGASRALEYLFLTQQKDDGSFPQNSRLDGTPVWEGLQLDEVALPIVLAHQLGRTDGPIWNGVKKAADFLVGYPDAPSSPQDRWENQSGYSPATIAASIAGLVCAAAIARANGDEESASLYEKTADRWRANVKKWTVTSTGPYSGKPYFLRLTKDGQPDSGTTYDIGDSGPSGVDQRRVVDPGFLELVRLGVLPARDPVFADSLDVIDEQLGVPVRGGLYWYRASFDGYGEKADGSQWDYPLPADSRITRGRLWPLLNGERGEYELAAGEKREARRQLWLMERAAGPSLVLPEQVWDFEPPYRPAGTPTTSATPLTWTHAQYLRLAANLAAGRILEQPGVVKDRYDVALTTMPTHPQASSVTASTSSATAATSPG
ncbi:glucan 1,4-alpha-glucosidase [Actinoplanes sp. OR16]|uniref:glycoside hydrolase family 15 protein n=1 Tax=Actinoplanes sp. OR16 TaxID=946334 RepID=UPI000F6E3CCC|nr:glycoside hydrolase family 15 protein [Actinoplanes sp. OR16]BBH68850.1 glucan 1,4-alpha-glucosidase [Actinoplanes sp. OR16]